VVRPVLECRAIEVAVLTDGQKQRVALELCGGGETFEGWKACLDDLMTRGRSARDGRPIPGYPFLSIRI